MHQQTRTDRDRGNGDDSAVNDLLSDVENTAELPGIGSENDRDYLSYDEIFDVLYNRRRREVLTYLRDHDGTATASDLAEYIAAKENDTTVKQLSSSTRKRVYVGLYQNHLPMMDETGVIDYDKNRGTVRLRDSARELEPYLDDTILVNRDPIKAVSGLGLAAVVVLGVLEVSMFALVPDPLWIAFGLVGFLGIVVSDAYNCI